MKLPDEIQKYRGRRMLSYNKHMPGEIVMRWRSRIVPDELYTWGEQGAEEYLRRYGRGIGEDKVVLLAILAEAEQKFEMAAGFWKKAYNIQSGDSPEAKKIKKKKRQLRVLEQQLAKFGFASAPAHIITEIEDLRREIDAYELDHN
jgi:hypothetical protein